MKNIFCLSLLIIIMAAVVTGFALFSPFRASGKSLDLNMGDLESLDIENDLYFDSAFGANNRFAVNPYQTVNPDQRMAVLIGASVSYLLNEVKSFTMFTVALMVLAIVMYVIAVSIILNKITKPREDVSDKEHDNGESAPVTGNNAVMGQINDSSRFNSNIEEQTSNTAFLTLIIDEMLSDIDSTLERSKLNRRLILN